MKISIIIAAYNAEKFIDDTIRSAISQTVSDKEIIIINDGSSDNTLNIAKRYIGIPGVQVFDLGYNRGAANAYNFGVLHSSGEYVTLLDSDDLYMPNYAERLLAFMEMNQADIGFSNYQAIEGTQITNMTLYGDNRHPKYIYSFGGVGHTFPNGDQHAIRELVFNIDGINISPRSIYKRSLFLDCGLDDHRLKISNDWMRNFKFMINGARPVYLNEVLGYYRFHSDGNSQKNPLANVVDIVKVFEIILNELRSYLTDEEVLFMKDQRNTWRNTMFSILAKLDLTTNQIARYILENAI